MNQPAQIFQEFAQHITDDLKEIREKISISFDEASTKKNRQSLAVTVRSWKKSDATTFFLGMK